MPYLPIIPEASDRRRLGIVPIDLINCMVEPNPTGAQGRSKYVIVGTPGRIRRAELPGFVRELYAEPGVQGGALFAAAGSQMYSISSTWAATPIGSILGADTVQCTDFRSVLAVLAGGQMSTWDGATFSNITDHDAPNPAGSLTSAAYRLIASSVTGDAFGWSKAGLSNDWDPNGVAANFDLPDPIVGQGQQGGDLISFGSRSIQRWRPTGGIESEAFSPIASGLQNMGLAGRDLVCQLNGGLAFVNDRGQPGWIGGGAPTLWDHRAFSDDFNRLAVTARENALGWAYQEGEVGIYGVRAAGMPRAYVYDTSTRLWHQRERYGYATTYDLGHAARAYDAVVGASPELPYIYELSRDVFTDDGDPIIRTMTVRADLPNDMTIASLALDIVVLNQPLSGQGSAPTLMLTYSRDGGQTWSDDYGDVREIALPPAGVYDAKPGDWQFGLFTRAHGAMFRLRISDPVRFAVQGVYLNQGLR